MEFPCISSSLSSSNAKLFFFSPLKTHCTEGKLKMVMTRERCFRSYKEELQHFVIFLRVGGGLLVFLKPSRNKTEISSQTSGNLSAPLSFPFPASFFPSTTLSNILTSVLKETHTGGTHGERPRLSQSQGQALENHQSTKQYRSPSRLSPLEAILFKMQAGHQVKRGLLL